MKLKRIFIFLVIIILIGLLSVFYPYLTKSKAIREYDTESCFVERVIDGDTLACDGQTIRLLGINTPERGEEYYQEAKDYLMQINNKEIYILRDFDDLDKYKRKLRYIFYEDRLINVEIVERGYAIAFMLDNLKYETKFIDAETFARNNCLNLWKKIC